MLGPRSRSGIDFLEKKKSEKVGNAMTPLVSYWRDMLTNIKLYLGYSFMALGHVLGHMAR